MIIVLGGEKGGTGKTILAVNLAAMRATAGHTVVLIDGDKQGSAAMWSLIREENGIKPSVPAVRKFGSELRFEALELARWQVGERTIESLNVHESYGEVPALPLHAERVNRAFVNLILNAFEACPQGGAVAVSSAYEAADASSGTVTVRIENTGEPVPPENIERIFEPFFSTKPTGTGLGLPIAYQIITSHGGTVDVESRNGKTVFSVRFPVAGGSEATAPKTA